MIQGVAASAAIDMATSPMSRMPDAHSAASAEKLGINQNGLSKVSGDQIADGFRAHLNTLLGSERRVHAKATESGDHGFAVKVIGSGAEPAGTKMIGETKPASDTSLHNLTSAFEYSTNMALVSMVLNGMTNGITTLTSKGG